MQSSDLNLKNSVFTFKFLTGFFFFLSSDDDGFYTIKNLSRYLLHTRCGVKESRGEEHCI